MMEQIKNKNGRQCSEGCPFLDEHKGIVHGSFECKLHTRIFRVRLGTVFGGPGDECPFAVLREVLVPQPEPADLPPKPLPWASAPTVQEFKDALARIDRLETMRQCNDCGWKNRRGCIPPLNGGKCLDWYSCFEPRRTTPVRADLTLTALRLDALRLEGVLRRASNDICEILSAPAAETRTCSGDWDNCTCMRCKLMRLRDWILRRAKETMP